MPLHRNHLEDLRASGLSDDQVAAAKIYSESDPAKVATLLNWKGGAKKLGPCCVFPYLDFQGDSTGHHRLKPDKPRKQHKKSGEIHTIKYEAPVGEPNRAYFTPGAVAAIANSVGTLILTEGEKKALALDQRGFPAVGLSGVWSWQQKRQRDADGKGIGPRLLIPDLAAIDWSDREVAIIFDSDAVTNSNVDHAQQELKKALESLGGRNHD